MITSLYMYFIQLNSFICVHEWYAHLYTYIAVLPVEETDTFTHTHTHTHTQAYITLFQMM